MIPFFKKAAKSLLFVCFLATAVGCKTTGVYIPTAEDRARIAQDPLLADYYEQSASNEKNNGKAFHAEMHSQSGVRNIDTLGDVIGSEGRADGIDYRNGKLFVHEGWLFNGTIDFAPVADEIAVGTRHYEFALAGNFFGDKCESILVYDTNGFMRKGQVGKHEMWRNNCYLSHRSEKKLVRVDDLMPIINPNLNAMVEDFVRDYDGYYKIYAADFDGEGRDDLLFSSRYQGVAVCMILYANSFSNRSDNLQFGHSPKGYKVQRFNLGRTIGNIFRTGNVKGGRNAELVVLNPKARNSLETQVYKFVAGKLVKDGTRKFYDVPFKNITKVFMADANNNGYDNLISISQLVDINYMQYVEFN